MPSAQAHEQHAASNWDFYQSLGGTRAERGDWAMTALFYCAVHQVQAIAVRKNWKIQTEDGTWQLPENHKQRGQAIRRYAKHLWATYSFLQDNSQLARYECEPFNQAQLALAERELKSLQAQ